MTHKIKRKEFNMYLALRYNVMFMLRVELYVALFYLKQDIIFFALRNEIMKNDAYIIYGQLKSCKLVLKRLSKKIRVFI